MYKTSKTESTNFIKADTASYAEYKALCPTEVCLSSE